MREHQATYCREKSELMEDRDYDYGCNPGSHLRDAVDSKNITHPPLEQYITRTKAIQCPTVRSHTPHCMQAGGI